MRRFPQCYLIVALMLALGVLLRGQDSGPLLNVAEVRTLPERDAAAARPAKIEGVVTYVAPVGSLFFIQDASGGICVSGVRDRQTRADLRPGVMVEVEAITSSTRGRAYLTARRRGASHVKVTRSERILPEPKVVSVAQLSHPQFQEVRVEVSGVIRSVQSEPLGAIPQETLLFTLADGRDRLTVALAGWRSTAGLPRQFVGATVRIRGVYSETALERQPLVANRLLISSLKDIQIEASAHAPFKRDVQTVAEVRGYAEDDLQPERLRIRGVATVAIPGKGMFVEDATGGLWVDTIAPSVAGEQVDAVGFAAMREGNAVLEDAVWRKSPETTVVPVPLVTASAAMSGALNGRMVQIEALLLAISAAGEGPTLVLKSDERVFLARCGNPKIRLQNLRENSWLRVSGVCVNSRPMLVRETGAGHPASFHLLISGPQSIEIARAPSWWTVQRIVAVVASLAIIALGAMVWATTLRRRVAIQTDQIREHLAREAVSEERLRIARELHDSVQQDLLGITMQLKATERLLQSAPERALHALSLASAMARRSQAETHRAVWDLREAANEHSDLVVALDDMVAGMNAEDNARVEFSYTGERRALPQTVESQVLRVAQEAVTNAIKHGAAKRIDVALHFGPERLTLMVCDDGRGFDADHPPSATSGHFGLFGMRERAIKLGGELRVVSRVGEGTAVNLEVPVPAETGGNETLHTPSGLRLMPRPSTT